MYAQRNLARGLRQVLGQDSTLVMTDDMRLQRTINAYTKRLSRTTTMKKGSENDNKDALHEVDICTKAYHVTTGSKIHCSPRA